MTDWTPVINAAIEGTATIVGALFTAALGWFVTVEIPAAIAAFEKRTGVQVTDQERTAIYSAVNTGAGNIQTLLHQGALKLEDIRPDNPEVVAQAEAARASVPDSAAAQGTSVETIARKIVSAVDTSSKAPAIVMVPAVPPPAPAIPRI